MKPAAVREMTDEELVHALGERKREYFNLRVQAQTGQLENSARIRTVRRDVARLRTEENARRQVRA